MRGTLLPSSGRSGAERAATPPELDFCWLGGAAEPEPGFTESPGAQSIQGAQGTLSAHLLTRDDAEGLPSLLFLGVRSAAQRGSRFAQSHTVASCRAAT